MITDSDFIVLDYTPDLTQAGVAYACRSLPYTYNRMGGSSFDRLRRIVAGVGVELAFRRHLQVQEVPFDVSGLTPFTEPDRYDLAIGGRRCDVKSFLIFKKERIRKIRSNPAELLGAPALVPADQLMSDSLRYEDLYVFVFLNALVTPHRLDVGKALAAGQPHSILHPMPEDWSRPLLWESLGRLALKGDLSKTFAVEIGGQDINRTFQVETVMLAPRQRLQVQQKFYSLSYLKIAGLPDGRMGVHSPTLKETYLVGQEEWGNIWVYGLEVFLAGYVTVGEFRRRAKRVPAGTRVLQYDRTRTENMAIPIGELHPIPDLCVRAKNWAQRL